MFTYSCHAQPVQKNHHNESFKMIRQDIIISDNGEDTLFVNDIEVNKTVEKEIIFYDSYFKSRHKLGKIDENFQIVSVYFSYNELNLLGVGGSGGIYIYSFKKGVYCSKVEDVSWYHYKAICGIFSPSKIDIIDRFGIANIQWSDANVVKIKQIKENIPEKVFALIGDNFRIIYEGELIKEQKYYEFSDEYNKFSNYLNQKPWDRVFFGGNLGIFVAPDKYSANKK